MATLTDDEMARIKAELLDNVLSIGALPYASILAVYDLIRGGKNRRYFRETAA